MRIRLFSTRNLDPTAALCIQVSGVTPVSNTATSQLVCAHEWAGEGLALAVLTGVGDDASVAGRVLDEMLAHRLHHAAVILRAAAATLSVMSLPPAQPGTPLCTHCAV